MAVPSATLPRQIHHFTSTDHTQANGTNPPLLQLPIELLEIIAKLVATGPTLDESAKNAIQFGQVCILTHRVSHNEEIEKIVSNTELEAAIVDLATAIVERELTDRESKPLKTVAEMGVNRRVRWEEKAKCKVLHDVFKANTTKYGISQTSDGYARQAVAIQQTVRNLCLKMVEREIPDYTSKCLGLDFYSNNEKMIDVKITRALKTFTRKIIDDIVAEYASQPLTAITIKNFKKKALHLEELFAVLEEGHDGSSYSIFVEATIRKAIFTRHTIEEFTRAAINQDNTIARFYKELSNRQLESSQSQGIRSIVLHDIID